DDETSRWLAGLPDVLHRRLVRVGLASPRKRSGVTLGAFLDEYFASLAVKPATLTAYGHTRRCLLEYFGESTLLADIGPADADKWRTWLKTANIRDRQRQTMSESTIARRVGVARQMFRRAVKWGADFIQPLR
ncbi:MAG TPA: hypothetical protein VNL70_02990, partial [Tepidisphaeraceae bacterium]|nr:hypothetical protein [Tepidisphaeraceae bacterium]